MSNPENKTATQQEQNTQVDSLENKVKAAVKQLSEDDNGNIIFPEELKKSLDADTLFAVTAEHRRRSTQSAYTRNQQKLKALEAENGALRGKVSDTAITFTQEEQDELDTLKFKDPDAWREKLNELEISKRSEAQSALNEVTTKVKTDAELQFEAERRQQVLKEFNDSTDIPITDELIANEVPPRITNKLANGEISFEEFLVEVSTYVKTGKVVSNPDTLDQPNMSKLGGGTTPTDMKPEGYQSTQYANTIF